MAHFSLSSGIGSSQGTFLNLRKYHVPAIFRDGYYVPNYKFEALHHGLTRELAKEKKHAFETSFNKYQVNAIVIM